MSDTNISKKFKTRWKIIKDLKIFKRKKKMEITTYQTAKKSPLRWKKKKKKNLTAR